MTKKYIIALFIIMILAVSCMQNPSRPKRTRTSTNTNSNGVVSKEEDFVINVDEDKTVKVMVDTDNFWQNNEDLSEIYSNQMYNTYIYDGTPIEDIGFRYKIADNLDFVDPKNPATIYKKYIRTVLVKVNLYTDNKIKEQYVAGGIYQVIKEKEDEKRIEYQPVVNGYEILVYNYNAKSKVQVPPNRNYKTLSHLYRYNLPIADAGSSYDPDKVFEGEYKKINDAPADWFILPAK